MTNKHSRSSAFPFRTSSQTPSQTTSWNTSNSQSPTRHPMRVYSRTASSYAPLVKIAPSISRPSTENCDIRWRTVQPFEHLMLEEYEPYRPEILTLCVTLSHNVTLSWVYQIIIPRLLSHPRFRSTIVNTRRGCFIFEPVMDFSPNHPDIVNHVKLEPALPLELPSPSEQSNAFITRLNDIASSTLPRDRPLWCLHLFRGWSHDHETRGKSATLVLRAHHALTDGFGLVKFFLARVADAHKGVLPSELIIQNARTRKSNVVTTGDRISGSGSGSSSARRRRRRGTLADGMGSGGVFGGGFSGDGDHYYGPSSDHGPMNNQTHNNNIWSSGVWPRMAIHDVRMAFNSLSRQPDSEFTRESLKGKTKCALSTSHSVHVASVQRAARRLDISLNDILLAAVSGGTRTYLSIHGDDVATLRGMRVAIPVHRPYHRQYDPYEATDVGQRCAAAHIPLWVDIPSRMERLCRCSESMRKLKRHGLGGGFPGNGGGTGSNPSGGKLALRSVHATRVLAKLPPTARRITWAHMASGASMLFSNVAGPVDEISVGHVDVSEMYYVPPAGNHVAVNIGMMSYNGCLFIAVSGDVGRLSNPQGLVDAVIDEIFALISLSYSSRVARQC